MKLKKLLAGITAAALAVSAMAFSAFAVNVTDGEALVGFADSASASGKVMLNYSVPLSATEAVTIKASDILAAIGKPDAILSGVSGVSLEYTVNEGTVGSLQIGYNSASSWVQPEFKDLTGTGTIQLESTPNASADGFSLKFGLYWLNEGQTLTINSVSFTATYVDEMISASNFTYSAYKNEAMKIGDSFTITYNSAKTPKTAKYMFKYKYNDGTADNYYDVVKDDGTVDNGIKDIVGVEVSSATAGNLTTYTFTAVSASKYAFQVNVETSPNGTWQDGDHEYLWFAEVSYKVVVPETAGDDAISWEEGENKATFIVTSKNGYKNETNEFKTKTINVSDILASGMKKENIKKINLTADGVSGETYASISTEYITSEGSSSKIGKLFTFGTENDEKNAIDISMGKGLSSDTLTLTIERLPANSKTTFVISFEYDDTASDTPSETKKHTGSATMKATDYDGWYEAVLTKEQVFGDLDPAKTTVTFEGANLSKVGYNSISTGDYKGIENVDKFVIDGSDVALDGFYLHVGGSAATEVTWTAVEGGTGSESSGSGTTTPAEPETPAPSAPLLKPIEVPAATVDSNSSNSSSAADSEAASTEASAAETAKDNGTSVSLKKSTKVSKAVIERVSGKDSVEFELSNGASWVIDGKDVADVEGMDLGITLNTKTADSKQLKTVADGKNTFQFSLNHNGDFGFKAVVNIPVNKKYNGQYANLYWFHDGKFDFIGSSKVEGGIADFTMTHASDYVIVFDKEAYGEDVSSTAGISADETTRTASASAAAPITAAVVIAALAASAVIFEKKVLR